MRDPFEELEHFTNPGLTMDPLPAAEVRRRGTRMRRRRTALTTIGAVAAVAVIATPIAMAANGSNTGGHTPDPAGTPTATHVTWVTTIPDNFPLTTGLPQTNGHDGSPVTAHGSYEQQSVDACADEGWTIAEATDVRQAIYTGESEGGQSRTLALYETDSAATRALSALTERVEECATARAGRGRHAEVVRATTDTLAYADHVSAAGDMFVHRVVRIGNALLLDSTYAMGGGDPRVVRQTADLLEETSAEVIDRMCAFAADPC